MYKLLKAVLYFRNLQNKYDFLSMFAEVALSYH